MPQCIKQQTIKHISSKQNLSRFECSFSIVFFKLQDSSHNLKVLLICFGLILKTSGRNKNTICIMLHIHGILEKRFHVRTIGTITPEPEILVQALVVSRSRPMAPVSGQRGHHQVVLFLLQ